MRLPGRSSCYAWRVARERRTNPTSAPGSTETARSSGSRPTATPPTGSPDRTRSSSGGRRWTSTWPGRSRRAPPGRANLGCATRAAGSPRVATQDVQRLVPVARGEQAGAQVRGAEERRDAGQDGQVLGSSRRRRQHQRDRVDGHGRYRLVEAVRGDGEGGDRLRDAGEARVRDARVDVEERGRGRGLARGHGLDGGGLGCGGEEPLAGEQRHQPRDRLLERPPRRRDADQSGTQAGGEAYQRRSRSSAATMRKSANTRRSATPPRNWATV